MEGCLFSPGLPSFYPLSFPSRVAKIAICLSSSSSWPFVSFACFLSRYLFLPLCPPAITLTLKGKLPELVKCLFSAFLLKHKLLNPSPAKPHPPISVESASFSTNPSFQGFRETKTPFHSTWPPLSPTRCKLAIRVIMRRHRPALAGTGICIRDRVGYWATEVTSRLIRGDIIWPRDEGAMLVHQGCRMWATKTRTYSLLCSLPG